MLATIVDDLWARSAATRGDANTNNRATLEGSTDGHHADQRGIVVGKGLQEGDVGWKVLLSKNTVSRGSLCEIIDFKRLILFNR